MNKLKVDRKDLENFKIEKLKNYEGCPEAVTHLYKDFGDKVDSIFNHEEYFFKLIIEHNKPHWSNNFILNLMLDKYRFKFLNMIMKEVFKEIKDENLKKELKSAIKALNNNETYNLELVLNNFQNQAELLMGNILADEDKYNFIMFNLLTIQAINYLLRDTEKKFTRSLTICLSKIGEAQNYLDPSLANENTHQKKIALRLLDYSGFFK